MAINPITGITDPVAALKSSASGIVGLIPNKLSVMQQAAFRNPSSIANAALSKSGAAPLVPGGGLGGGGGASGGWPTNNWAGSGPNPSAPTGLSQASSAVGASNPPKSDPAITWTGDSVDWRVKVSVGAGSNILYEKADAEILAPVRSTGGVIFPITPQIQMTHTAKYSALSPTHSNYSMQFYESSDVGAININADFPIQNIQEGQYLLAAIYFFRAATKMFWGNDEYAGAPPPMLFVTGYGKYYFPNVPCVLTSFMHTMPEDKDYIEVPLSQGQPPTRLPTHSTLQIVLQPIYSRASMTTFKTEDLAAGRLIGKGFV